jgi:putative ATPase
LRTGGIAYDAARFLFAVRSQPMSEDEELLEASLFERAGTPDTSAPLADRIRPRTLEEFAGQRHIIGEGALLRRMVEQDRLVSLLFWGPPGTGKTTLAFVLARMLNARFVTMSAVTSGVKDVKACIERATAEKRQGRRTILFIDEIHRFNKAQQDALLPHVERGTVTFIGATTENPSFDVNSALLSRCRVFVLKQLLPEDIEQIVRRAVSDRGHGLGGLELTIDDDAVDALAKMADGDARIALNALEAAANVVREGDKHLTRSVIIEALQQRTYDYDRAGEGHYNLISALHKSVRSSDVNASLYWLARMIDAGEDPRYLARRMVRMAVEDIGLTDPRALSLTLAAHQTYHMLGSPEGELALAEAVVYLATAPKSNAIYVAFGKAMADAREHGSLQVPLHIRNAPTRLMKDLGYGDGYQYDHNLPDSYSGQQCLPDELAGKQYYEPTQFGYEKTVAERMRWWAELREKMKEDKGEEG